MLRKKLLIIAIVMTFIAVVFAFPAKAYPPSGYDIVNTTALIQIYDPLDSTVLLEAMNMTGHAVIWRSNPYDPGDGRITIDTRMDTLVLRGYSILFGDSAFVTLNRTAPLTTGAIQQITPGLDFPAESFFDVYYQITIGQLPNPPKFKATFHGGYDYDLGTKEGKVEIDAEQQSKAQSQPEVKAIPLEGLPQEWLPGTPPQQKDPADYCEALWQGPGAFFIGGYLTGDEYYAAYQDPDETGCLNTYPFGITDVIWHVFSQDSVTIEIQPLVYNYDGPDQIGAELCAGPLYTVALPNSGGWIITMPLGDTCCVNGPYYAGVYIATALGPDILEIVTDDGVVVSPRSDATYNNQGSGWVDLVDDSGFTWNLRLWSGGYNSDQNECSQTIFTNYDPPHMWAEIWQIPPHGRAYQDPRKTPIYDLATGEIVGYVWHKHKVNRPEPGTVPIPTTGTMGVIQGPNPPGPTTEPDEVIQVVGTSIVGWGDFYYNQDEKLETATELIQMNMTGQSELFGEVILSLPAGVPPSTGLATALAPGDEFFPAESFFDVYYQVELPDEGIIIAPADPGQPPRMETIIEAIPPYNNQYVDAQWHPIHSMQQPGLIIGWVRPIHWVRPAEGACCDTATGACRITTQFGCNGPNEIYMGDGISCIPNPCPQPQQDEDCFESEGRATVTLDIGDPDCAIGAVIPLSSILSPSTKVIFDPGPYAVGGTINTEIVQLELSGNDANLGLVIIRERGDKASTGYIEVTAVDGGGNLTQGESFFDVYVEVDLPDMGMLLNTDDSALHLEATIYQLPPDSAYFPPPDHPPLKLYDAITLVHEGWLCHAEHLPTIEVPCDEPKGACCDTIAGGCRMAPAFDCVAPFEEYKGDNTSCVPNPCITGCCNGDGMRGNVDGLVGPASEIDVADLSYLVDYLFKGGPVPPCIDEGNVDGIVGPGGPIDVSDLSYLVDYLFKGGPPPAQCP